MEGREGGCKREIQVKSSGLAVCVALMLLPLLCARFDKCQIRAR